MSNYDMWKNVSIHPGLPEQSLMILCDWEDDIEAKDATIAGQEASIIEMRKEIEYLWSVRIKNLEAELAARNVCGACKEHGVEQCYLEGDEAGRCRSTDPACEHFDPWKKEGA